MVIASDGAKKPPNLRCGCRARFGAEEQSLAAYISCLTTASPRCRRCYRIVNRNHRNYKRKEPPSDCAHCTESRPPKHGLAPENQRREQTHHNSKSVKLAKQRGHRNEEYQKELHICRCALAADLSTWREFHNNRMLTENHGIHSGFITITQADGMQARGRRQARRALGFLGQTWASGSRNSPRQMAGGAATPGHAKLGKGRRWVRW